MRGGWCAALLLAAVALAGCSGGEAGGKDASDSAATATTADAPALTAAIAVSANGTAIAPANGTVSVPRGEAVTFDASGSKGAIVTYAWSFGDDANATSDERVAEHVYGAPGNHTVRLTVGNGNLTANATLEVAVVGVLAGQPLFTAHHETSGNLPVGNPNSPTTEGTDYVDHVVPILAADANGTAAQAIAARITVTASGLPVNQLMVYWKTPAGEDLATTGGAGETGPEYTIAFDGGMPPGDHVLRVRLFLGAQASYTATVDVDYVTA